MNLHEYQAKALFAEYGLPVSIGKVAETPEQAVAAAREISQATGDDAWVVKVQVHAGGRGKAGGVKLVHSLKEVRDFAEHWIGNRLVSVQTGESGQPVDKVYLEELTNIDRELYLGAVIDRAQQRVVFMASTEGGVEIETVAAETPELILKTSIEPLVGAQSWQGRDLAFRLGLSGQQVGTFAKLFVSLSKLFHECDCSLVEINPLVITKAGKVHCLDAKLSIDDNALYRHKRLAEMRDTSQDDLREAEASEHNLNYVALEGSIGCMVNGAGLAMGTMDLVKTHGGQPANFLDVGGGATRESVSEAFKIILSDASVRAVLINIFGGIVSCRIIADGIVGAVRDVGVRVPVVVRFEGNNADAGRAVLAESGLNIIAAESLTEAAKKAIEAAGSAA